MSAFFRFNLLLLFIFLGSHISLCQQKKLDLIKNSDHIYDSRKAYDFLDSMYTKGKLDVRSKSALLERLVQRSLELNDYSLLSQYCIEGIGFSQQHKLDSAQAFFYKFLGFSQSFNHKLTEAVASFKKSAEIARKSGNPFLEVTNYNNMGGMLIDLKVFGEAESYLMKSIALSEKNGLPSLRNKLLSYRLLATLYQRTNREEKCRAIFDRVEKDAFLLNDTNLICSNLVFYADFLQKQGQLTKALEKTQAALKLIRIYGDFHSLKTTLQFHAANLARLKRYEEAFAANQEVIGLTQKIYKAENQNQINELETRFKTKEIAQGKKLAEIRAMADRQEKNNYLFVLVIVLSTSVIAFLLIYLRNVRKSTRARHQNQEEQIKSAIEAQEKERSRIAKELHDGIVQDMTVLKMRLNTGKTVENQQELTQELDKITKEVREISYQMMPVSLREFGLVKALEELFSKSFENQVATYSFEVFGMDTRLAEKQELSLYRICQELINNALKHAQASSVAVVLKRSGNVLSLVFEDNGKGFDPEKTKRGIGLLSIHSRLQFIRGEMELDSSIRGTVVYIRVPY